MPFPSIWHGIIGFLIEMYKENKKKQIINNLRNYKSIDKIISFVKENRGIEYSQKVMNNLVERSEEILENFPNSDYKITLKKLIGYTIKRQE